MEVSSLFALVLDIYTFPSHQDSRLRTPSSNGLFSISSFFSILSSPPSSLSFPHTMIWFPPHPLQNLSLPLDNSLELCPYLRHYPKVQPPSSPFSQFFLSLLPCRSRIRGALVYSIVRFLGDYGVVFYSWST